MKNYKILGKSVNEKINKVQKNEKILSSSELILSAILSM